MILVIGEILFDQFPKYRRLGGAAFNFAYHLKNVGLDVRFISRIGRDDAGKDILRQLASAQFNLDDLQIDEKRPTGSVTIQLDTRNAPQFDIIDDVAYDYIEFIPEYHSSLIEAAEMIYFGSLIQRSAAGRENLHAFINWNSPHKRNFYDINLRPGCYDNAMIEKSLLAADILKLSSDEIGQLKKMVASNQGDDEFINHLMQTYAIQVVSLTKGASGSDLFSEKGRFSFTPTEPVAVVDAVGAGDAYAAIVAAGLLKAWSPEKILAQASRFASRICEIKGAIPDSTSFYEPFYPLFV